VITTAADASWFDPRGSAPAKVALGAMNFGGRCSEPISRAIVERAIARGVGLVDTANAYGNGASERIVGQALAGLSKRPLVATKVGLLRERGQVEGLSRRTLLSSIDASLERLKLDAVDLYYLHAPDPKTPIEETMDAVAALFEAKKIRRFGVSNFASWQVLEIVALSDARGIPRPAVSQVIHNLLVRQIEVEHLTFAARYGLHVTVYNPLAGGLLSGKHEGFGAIQKGSRFDRNDLYKKRYWTERAFAMTAAYRALAEESGLRLIDLAYAFSASTPHVQSVLVGPASVEQLDDALDACAAPIAPSVRAEVDALHHALVGTDARYARS
jgi:aryl-alcohol dehydrogenase-like predicted oxidoreductase